MNAPYWQRRISREMTPAIPIYVRGLRLKRWVTPGQYRLTSAIFDGRWFTIRALAEKTGYSRSGVHKALHALERMAIGHIVTSRGCRGMTRFVVQRDVIANVLPSVRLSVESLTSLLKDVPSSYVRSLENVPVGWTFSQVAT